MLNRKAGRQKTSQRGAQSTKAEGKEKVVASCWAFIFGVWPLRMAAYAVGIVGIIAGAYKTVIELPPPIVEGTRYVFGVAPKADQLLLERNAFLGGMVFRDIYEYGPDVTFGASRLHRLERICITLGIPELEVQTWAKLTPVELRRELLRSRERLDGRLEKLGQRYLEFFHLGLQLGSLIAESSYTETTEIVLRNNEVLNTYGRIAKLAPYRLPTLPLPPLNNLAELPKDYAANAVQSFLQGRVPSRGVSPQPG